MLYIPKDTWLTSIECLNTIWRRLRLTGVDGDGRRMTLIDFSFSSLAVDLSSRACSQPRSA